MWYFLDVTAFYPYKNWNITRDKDKCISWKPQLSHSKAFSNLEKH